MSSTVKVEYRRIAKMLCSHLPVEDDGYSLKVEEMLKAIKALKTEAKTALTEAYIFSHKVPREEREDMFQDLVLNLLKANTKDERLAYSIARCDWKDWWSKFRIRQHYSLDSVIDDGEGNETTLAETIVGEAEWELKMDGDLDAKRLWDKLPPNIKAIVQQRLLGQALNANDRQTLSRWMRSVGYSLI